MKLPGINSGVSIGRFVVRIISIDLFVLRIILLILISRRHATPNRIYPPSPPIRIYPEASISSPRLRVLRVEKTSENPVKPPSVIPQVEPPVIHHRAAVLVAHLVGDHVVREVIPEHRLTLEEDLRIHLPAHEAPLHRVDHPRAPPPHPFSGACKLQR